MLRIFFIASIAAAILTTTCYAGPAPKWFHKAIKVNNPNQLPYFVWASESCPLNAEDLAKITEGVFIRSRLKPLRDGFYPDGTVYFSLSLTCLHLENNNPVFNIDANFSRYRPFPAIIYDYGFGNYGIGDKSFMEQSIKKCTEDAVTEFIKSNFDL